MRCVICELCDVCGARSKGKVMSGGEVRLRGKGKPAMKGLVEGEGQAKGRTGWQGKGRFGGKER